ncbi:hypothetical protein [Streptomyces coerulescens]|uniref:NACHT domain-containing protein n=1 Tax=Streptomyces coerulescens TaxID=29304 RepID=A0ABW0CJS6_STRCD
MRWWGKQRSVAAGQDIGLAVTGDHNRILLASPVRSAYWEQVRRIAPPQLVGRDDELAALADFCTAESGPVYAWWRAPAWAGKTALMSRFALNPPPGARIVPFFVTARLGAQNDVVAYVDVVLEQLAELAGEDLPAHLTEATREAHLLHLYGAAARACAAHGERLILLLDGLDEDRGVTTGPDAHSIAALLPARPDAGMRVLVAGRLNPPLPGDVPDNHPLRDPAIVRTLSPSPYARAVRTEAERELKRLIEAGGLEYDLLGLVTAAGGGLTAEDLAALTGAVPYDVRDVLRTRAGRTFGVRASVYLLGHEELQSQAEEMLGARELDRYRGELHAWAEEWRARGWPADTPEYLLRGYFRMLRGRRDLPRMVGCAVDETRHDRMLEATGGDAAALTEIRTTEDLLVESGTPDLLDVTRLALRREELEGRNDLLTRALPRAWAALGRTRRAEALARSIPDPGERVHALVDVAGELANHGDADGAVRLLEEAEAEAGPGGRVEERDRRWVLTDTFRGWLHLGLPDHADDLFHAEPEAFSLPRAHFVCELALSWAQSGDLDRAEALCLAEEEISARALGAAGVASVWVRLDRLDRAESLARAAGPGAEALVLLWTAHALRLTGREDDARRCLARVDETMSASPALWYLVRDLVDMGEYARAEAAASLLESDKDRAWSLCRVAGGWAGAGEIDRARALAERIEQPEPGSLDRDVRAEALRGVAKGLADSGAYEELERLVRDHPDGAERARARASLVEVLTAAGDLDRAEALAREAPNRMFDGYPLHGVIEARALAGDFDRSLELARLSFAATDRHDSVKGYEALLRGAVAAAANDSGTAERVTRLVAGVEAELRRPSRGGSLKAALSVRILGRQGETAAAEAVLAQVEIPEIPGPDSDEAPDDRDLEFRVAEVAEALAWTGRFDEAEDLVRRFRAAPRDRSRGFYFYPEEVLVEPLCERGQFDRATALTEAVYGETRDRLRTTIVDRALRAGDAARARALVAELTRGQYRARAHALLVLSLAASGDAAGAARAHADAEGDFQRGTYASAVGDVLRAYLAVGQDAAGARLLARVIDRPRHDPADRWSVLRGMVVMKQYDRALELVRTESGDDGSASRPHLLRALIEALVSTGEHTRAEELVRTAERSGTVPGADRARFWQLLAPGTDPARGRLLLARALRYLSLQDVLPTLIRVEPGTVPLIVDALAGRAAAGTPPTAARTSARSGS